MEHGPSDQPPDAGHTVQAVLCDRDGTLIVDVPYNGDPRRVAPLPGVSDGLDRLRGAGMALAIVSNQSGVARGVVTTNQVAAVNRRVVELLGPFDAVLCCPHGPDDGCRCRKPRPGLVIDAAGRLGVPAARCAVIGDIGADIDAAEAAGARGILVPDRRTLRDEVRRAREVAPDFGAAVEQVLATVARPPEPMRVRS
jgi:D-glycero-D-manno-heptose 1,7-bisphosphate phosphatase